MRNQKSRIVLIRSDNVTTIAYINHMGGTKSAPCSAIAQRIWQTAIKERLQLQAEYISTDLNHICK
jgi:hypothetical protein